MFKVNYKNNRDVSDIFLVFLLLTFNIFHNFFSVFIVNFEQENVKRMFA